MTTTVKKPRVRKVAEVIYLVEDGEMFHGTLAQFKDCFFSNATELSMTEWARDNNFKLQKRHKRGRELITTTLYDPAKPEQMKFGRIKWGKDQGKRDRSLTYTDSDGNDYTFYLTFARDSRHKFGNKSGGKLAHKHEIEFRILEKLVKAVTGKEEPE